MQENRRNNRYDNKAPSYRGNQRNMRAETRKVRLSANVKQDVAGQSDDLRNDITNLTKMKDLPNQDSGKETQATDELLSPKETIQINLGGGKRSMRVIAKEGEEEGNVTESQEFTDAIGDSKVQRSNSNIAEHLDGTHVGENGTFNKFRSNNSQPEYRYKVSERSRSKSPNGIDFHRNSCEHSERSPQIKGFNIQRSSFHHYPRNSFGEYRSNQGRDSRRDTPSAHNNHHPTSVDDKRNQHQQRLSSSSHEMKAYPASQNKNDEEKAKKLKEEINQIDLRLGMNQQPSSQDKAISSLESESINCAIHDSESSSTTLPSSESQATKRQPTPSSKDASKQSMKNNIIKPVSKATTVKREAIPTEVLDKVESTPNRHENNTKILEPSSFQQVKASPVIKIEIKEEPPEIFLIDEIFVNLTISTLFTIGFDDEIYKMLPSIFPFSIIKSNH